MFLRLKSAFISSCEAHLSIDSNNSLCSKVQYVIKAIVLHSLKVSLRGVKDWVHMKTAKMMQDFNCFFCDLDVNHKLLLKYIKLFTFVHYTTR